MENRMRKHTSFYDGDVRFVVLPERISKNNDDY